MDNNRKKKILLIQPKKNSYYGRHPLFPPLSLVTLASMTPTTKYTVKVVDEQIEKINFNEKVDLVGITCHTIQAKRAYQIADMFRSKGIKVVLGGIHPTFLEKEAKKHCDSVVLGEAEEIWLNLLDDLNNNKLKNIYNGGFTDMSNVPILDPKYISQKYVFITVQATRGCPNKCEFCSVSVFNGRIIRERPISDVIKEIKILKKNKKFIKNFVFIIDDNLFANRKYAIDLFNRIKELKIYWLILAPVRVAFDKELIDVAYKSGCRMMGIGFESINQESLNSVNKSNTIDKYEKAIKILKKKGIFVWALFVLGLDGDDENTLKNTLAFSIKNNVDRLLIQMLRPLPGTKLFNRFKK